MERRKFLLTSGTALLGSTAVSSVSQQPAVALNFDLVGVEDVQPSNTDTILVDFQSFELKPKYVDETAGEAKVTITLDIEGHDSKQTQSTVSFINGQTVNTSDLGTAIPIVQDNISSSQTSLDGTITIDINHPDVSDSYQQSFTITDDPIQDGLVGYWPLHEWSGQANDLSGSGYDGTTIGATKNVWGRGGLTSYYFDGSSYIDTGVNDLGEVFSTPFSLSLWMRPDSVSGDNKFTGGNDSSGNWSFGVVNGSMYFSSYDSSNGEVYGILDGESVNTDKWYHVVAVHTGSEYRIYLDGGNSDSKSDSGFQSTSDDFYLGCRSNSGTQDQHFFGNISDIRVYNRALSLSEIRDLYALGSGDYTTSSLHDGTDSGAVSRWKFDGGTSDFWGTNDGVNKAGSGYDSNSIRNSSKVFDGSDDWVDCGDGILSSIAPDSITISAWVKKQNYSDWQVIIAEGDSNFNSIRLVPVTADNSNTGPPMFDYGDLTATPNRTLKDDEWYHLIGVYDSDASEAKLFVNGVLSATDSGSPQSIPDADVVSIGQDSAATTDGVRNAKYLNGNIDDLRIYDRALNSDEISQLYQWGTRGQDLRERTTTINKSDMVGWWKLNETNGTTAYDSSGNGITGDVRGGAGPTRTGIVNGPRGGTAYDFDGSDDNINFSNFNTFSAVTACAWLNFDNNSDGMADYAIGLQQNNDVIVGDDGSGNILVKVSNTTLTETQDNNKWVHVACVWDGSTVYGYADGVEFSSASESTMNNVGTGDGIGEAGDGSNNFDGQISDVRIYNRALTPQEVSYLYEQKF